MAEGGIVMGRGSELLLSLAFLALLGSLVLVVWRQGHVMEKQRVLDQLESARAVVDAESAALALRTQALESRGRVVPRAAAELGLRVPRSDEMVLLALPRAALAGAARR